MQCSRPSKILKGFIKYLHSYLKKEGIAIITESFDRVETYFPTHLKSDLRYSGKTRSLFQSQGFILVDTHPDFRSLVFAKGLRLRKKLASYFNGKLFEPRLRALYKRLRQIAKST